MKRKILLIGFAILCLSAVAKAQVTLYAVRNVGYFAQSSDAAPVTATQWNFDAQVRFTAAGDASAASLSGSTGGPNALVQSGVEWSYRSPDFATEAARAAAFPYSGYTVDYNAGTLGVGSRGPLTPVSSYPSNIPTLTGAAYSGLIAWRPALDGNYTVTFNTHVIDLSSTVTDTYITIYDRTTGGTLVESANLTAGSTAYTLNHLAYVSGHSYELNIEFFRQYEPSIGNIYIQEFTNHVVFSPVPEPSAYALVAGLAGAALGVLRRRRR